jgi:acetylornithine/succinyldiaminopimelate/putrescine aminotransferase
MNSSEALRPENDREAPVRSSERLDARPITRFTSSAATVLSVVEDHIHGELPTISAAGWLGTADAAKLGYVLYRLINQTNGITERWHTLAANSTLEAMYAVIRLCRQAAKEMGRVGPRRVLVYDQESRYFPFFDPLRNGPERALCPHVYFARTEPEFIEVLRRHRESWACTIVVAYPGQSSSAELRNEVDSLARSTQSMNVVCNSETSLTDASTFKIPRGTHVIIFGENLTNNEVPFGAFSIVAPLYATWGTRRSLSAYTSTFAGNATALGVALKALSTNHVSDADRLVFGQIDDSFEKRIEYFSTHVHPAFSEVFLSERKELHIVRAAGVNLKLANGKEVLDLSNLGCSLRGHNANDIIDRVLRNYDPNMDYLGRVEGKLRHLTTFSHVIPAVSGAGAVDNAVIMAMLAQPNRKTIVCFSGNYGGKTLVSVNLSKTAPLLANFDLPAFEPYYEGVVYVDPFAEDAVEQFVELVAAGGVALVWFEFIQGYMFRRLPSNLLGAIWKHRREHGYLIGVDEILTGMWKNGRTVLYHEEYFSEVDVVAMSKATSDMIFPISWALVTSEVFQRARDTDSSTVEALRRFYSNNFGASVALNALETADEFFNKNDLTASLGELHQGLRDVVATSELFSGIGAEGSLIRFHLSRHWFPFRDGTSEMMLAEGAVSKLLVDAAGILLHNLRMFLPCIHDTELHERILRRLMAGLPRLTPTTVYAYMLCQNHRALEALGMKDRFKRILIDAIAST